MIQLWLGVAALTLFALFFVFYPIAQARQRVHTMRVDTRKEDNIEVFKDRLRELEAERDTGTLSDQEFDVLKLELEKNLLVDVEVPESESVGERKLALGQGQWMLVIFMALLVPISSVAIYMDVGYPKELAIALNMPEDPFNGREPTLEEAIAQLRIELDAQPNNPEGWYVLGTTLVNQGRYDEGLAALREVEALLSEADVQYASVKGQVAQAMFFVAGGTMTDEVRAQVEATLEVEPFEITALGLKGIDAFEREAFREAVVHWQKALINADGAAAESFRSGIARAREVLEARGEDVSDIFIPEVTRIPVSVSVSDELNQNLDPQTPVFVIARPLEGGMPLAAVRLVVSDLPQIVELSDAQAMAPEMRLSSKESVSVSARISLSGNVTPQPGDLIGEITPVSTQGIQMPLELVVQEVVQ